MKAVKFVLAACLCVSLASDSFARSILTEADNEFRESAATQNRGTSNELASRQDDQSTVFPRNSVFYVRYPVADITLGELSNDITIQLHNRGTSLSSGRLFNEDNPGEPNAGMDFYILDPTLGGNTWDEGTVTPAIAAGSDMGYFGDGNYTTKATGTPGAPTTGLTYLGTTTYRDLDTAGGENALPADEEFNLTLSPGSDLHNAIVTAQGESHESITIAVSGSWEQDVPTSFSSAWRGYNYQFHSRESAVNEGNVDLTPTLELVPEPSSFALLALGSLALIRRRK